MRLVMMGTGPFGEPTFRKLYELPHQVVGLVTGRPRPRRGRRTEAPSQLRQIALEHGTPVYEPEDVNGREFRPQLLEFRADLWVVCDYGQILSADTLAAARLGGINVHASLLPKYRGAAPIQWAIYHGESTTGVSIIHMTPQLDAGPIIAQAGTSIAPEETAEDLERRLAYIASTLMPNVLNALEKGAVKPIPQDPAKASKAPRLKKTDGLIDWSRPAQAIRNQIRAVQPWPTAYTFWHRAQSPPLRLILGPVEVEETVTLESPGTVVEAVGDRLRVATGQGLVRLSSLQPAGKRMLSVEEFLRGYPLKAGHRFGPP